MFYVRNGFSRADNAGGTLTRDRWWPQAVAPTERGARWNFPVVRNTGHHFVLEASQLQLSQGPHTRPLPVEAGVEEGLAGVF